MLTEHTKQQIRLEVQHIFDSGANEIRVVEMIERLLEKPCNMLAEIEAWLSFNQEPKKDQTATLRTDIQKLLNG